MQHKQQQRGIVWVNRRQDRTCHTSFASNDSRFAKWAAYEVIHPRASAFSAIIATGQHASKALALSPTTGSVSCVGFTLNVPSPCYDILTAANVGLSKCATAEKRVESGISAKAKTLKVVSYNVTPETNTGYHTGDNAFITFEQSNFYPTYC